MTRIQKNALSNIATKLWSLVSIYIFIPFYIRILGEEVYGIVSFFATMQSAISILGFGLENTLRREFAIKTNNTLADNIRRKKLLNCIEIIYYGIAILISVVCFESSDAIALEWLNIGRLNPVYVANTVALMGASIALQIVANLYLGCIFGLNLQIYANIFQILWSVAKYCGSLLIISFLTVDLRGFYLWHVIVDFAYLLGLRIYLGKKLKTADQYHWSIKDFIILQDIWKYTLGVLLISIVALVNKQLDKVIISKFLSLTELGAYNLAVTLGSLTTIFASAMSLSVFSSFTSDIALGNIELVKKKFLKINKLVNIVTSCMFAFVAVFAIHLIQFWTRTTSYNVILESVAPLVVIAVSITEFQEIPYALALANGNTKTNVLLGVGFLPIVCFSTWYGIKNSGLFGAGIVYLVMMAMQTITYEFLIYRKYLTQKPMALILKDSIMPIVVSMVLAIASRHAVEHMDISNTTAVIMAVVFGLISLMIEILILDRTLLKEIIQTN